MATAVLKAIKKQYKKANILVSTAYPDVFINNPNVNKIITNTNNSGIYRDYVQNKDAKVFISDPYSTSDYITESKHLIQIWCEMFGVQYNGEMPELFLSKAEKQYYEPFYKLDKPIMAIQPHGGAINQPLKYSWTRDIPVPIMEQIIERFKEDYAIVHIKRDDQFMYQNTIGALDNFRSIAILLTMASKRLLIDSSAMHIATALNLQSIVTWVGTNPKVFGYDMHKNILANPFTKELDLNHSFYQKLPLFEDISKIPYNDLNEVFDVKKIIDELK
jgi:ADP-heptose:LPS heptosyltransferase